MAWPTANRARLSLKGGLWAANSQKTFCPVFSATIILSAPESLRAWTSSNGGSAICTSPVLSAARRACGSGTTAITRPSI